MILGPDGRSLTEQHFMAARWMLDESEDVRERMQAEQRIRDLRLSVGADPQLGQTITVRLPKRFQQ
jgi:hypothetical protein